MKITEIRTTIMWAGLRNWVIVKVLTDSDLYGWGEATLEGKEETVCVAVKQLGEALVGEDPLSTEHHWQVLYRHGFWRGGVVLNSALAGLDQALWDISGKAWGVPVYKLLGGPTRQQLRLYTHVIGHNAFVAGEEAYSYRGNVGTFTLFDRIDRTVGFIGYGGLARSLRPLLQPFRCKILAYDPWLPASYLARQGVEPAALDQMLARSDVIYVLAIPSASNHAMLDRALLEQIQPHAVLVLISRSHLVDFDALTDLLYQGRFRATIDVFPQEPLPKDHPIRSAPGVVLSAHRAGSVADDLRANGRMVVDDLEAMIAGLPPTQMQVAQPEIVYRLE